MIEYGYRDNGSDALSANGLNAKYGTGPSSFITYCIGISPYNDGHRSKTDIGDVLLYDSDSLTDNEASNNVGQHLLNKWVYDPCSVPAAPTNGDCTSSLTIGSICQPTCDSGYTVSITSSYRAGPLTAATCSAKKNPVPFPHHHRRTALMAPFSASTVVPSEV